MDGPGTSSSNFDPVNWVDIMEDEPNLDNMDDDEDENDGQRYTQEVLEELETSFHRLFSVLQELNYTMQHMN
jgi:hypothetical protein